MSVSTDGIICFGILFPDEEYSFPWNDDEYLENEDNEKYPYEWWDTISKDDCPVEFVNCCSHSYPIWIVAVKETVHQCSRGYPIVFNPESLAISNEQVKEVVDFCNKYLSSDQLPDMTPKWYLASYWEC